jgi:cysteinyl-tRNA synthetase
MNITDIDDKTIAGSQVAGLKLTEFTSKFTDAFLADIAKLNIDRADEIVPVTSLMPEMVKIVNKLLTRKMAYI